MGEARVKHSSSAGGENHAGPVRSRGDAALRAAAGGIFHPRSLRRQGPLRQMPREGERRAAPCLQDESAERRSGRPARDDARRHPDGHAHTAEGAGGPLGPWRGSRPRYDDGGAAALRPRRRKAARAGSGLERAGALRRGRYQPHPAHDGNVRRARRAVALYPRADRDAFRTDTFRRRTEDGGSQGAHHCGQYRDAAHFRRARGRVHRPRAVSAGNVI